MWRVIDASQLTGRLKYERGHLKIIPIDGDPVKVNLREIEMILAGPKTSVSTGLLQKLGELEIPMLILDWRNVPVSYVFGWSTHSRVGARQIAQANLSKPRRKSAWAAIIKSKICNQALVLDAFGKTGKGGSELREIAIQVRSGDPENREGLAARIYWSHLGLTDDFLRLQDNPDPWNGALNYGYTILRGAGIKAVAAAGLWPAVGIFHHGRSNAFNLVDDLIEPFRPVVDARVAQFPADFQLEDPDIRKQLVSCLQERFCENGDSMDTALAKLARSLGQFVEGDNQKLVIPKWVGP